jgi:hypothetical protein
MHECPDCGQACDCVGDDVWDDSEAQRCTCECDEGPYALPDEFDDDDQCDFTEEDVVS